MAAVLNSAEDAGMRPRVRTDIILADGCDGGGYVLRGGRDGRWKAAVPACYPDLPERDPLALEDDY
jgi:hypothetical protein